MNYKHYIGVDVSKHTLDFTVLTGSNFLVHQTVENTKPAIEAWVKSLRSTYKAGGKKTLCCIEDTGIYQTTLLYCLQSRKVPIWLAPPLEIHLSLGLRRGKNDKLDSLRIAQYAYTHHQKARLYQPPRAVIEELKHLRSLRERLVSVQWQLKHQTEEMIGYYRRDVCKLLATCCKESLSAVAKDLQGINEIIHAKITGDGRLNEIYKWLNSVTGIGPVLAIEMIITTNEFKNFSSPRKFACYCGVAPFRYTSGVNVHGKARVSKRANRRMKALLHLAAMSCVRFDNDYKVYFDRRVKQGLNKTSVLNVIRNKIIHRAFACVREERCYVK